MRAGNPIRVDSLGLKLRAKFAEAESSRRERESGWLDDLRQYKGVYASGAMEKMHPGRCRAFMRATRAKVKTFSMRMTNQLFPASGEPNWEIEPTEIPQVSERDVMQAIEAVRNAAGREPTQEEVYAVVGDMARHRAEAMAKEIRDQLEGGERALYTTTMRDVIFSGNLYGTGILKGPLVDRRVVNQWALNDMGSWALNIHEVLTPYIEAVQIWDVYPDPCASNVGDAQFIFQRHVYNRADLKRLAERPDFDADAINAYIREAPEGDASYKDHETTIRSMGGHYSTHSPTRNRYEVLEYWGYVSGKDLAECGCEVSEDRLDDDVAANIFLLNDRVIKADLSPIEGVRLPYYFYYFDKDESSIWGEGIASVMRDAQQLLNSTVRALMDNVAVSAGPQIEVNADLLPEGEDPTDIEPFRVWLRTGAGAEAQSPAVRVYTLPSYTTEFITLIQLLENFVDEASGIPRWLHSDDRVSGAGRTASGLSMLMGTANVLTTEQVRLFDDGITRPFITAMYHWNMQFNPREDVKGDFQIRAKGSAVLMQREVQAQALTNFMAQTANQLYAPYVKAPELLARLAKAMEVGGDDIVKTREEFEQEQAQAMASQAKAQLQAALAEVEARGGDPAMALMQALQVAAQQGQTGAPMIGASQGVVA